MMFVRAMSSRASAPLLVLPLLVLPLLLVGCRREEAVVSAPSPAALPSQAPAPWSPASVPPAPPTASPLYAPDRVGSRVSARREIAPPRPAPPDLAPEIMASARRGSPPARMTQDGETEAKLLGICSYTESAVTCWGPDGSPAPKLGPTVDGILRNGYGGSGQFKYGQKNRVLVFSRPRQANVSYRAEDGSENGGYLQSTSVQDSFGPQIEAVFVATFAGRDSGTLTVRTQPYGGRPRSGDLAPKVGASVVVDGVAVKVTAIAKLGKDDPYGNYGMGAMPMREGSKGPRWRVSFAVDRSKNPEASVSYAPIGADGQVVRFVDDSGKPKAPPKDPRGFGGGYNGGMGGVFQSFGGSAGEGLLLSVDPQYVKRFSVGVQRVQVAQFRDIPLDPRRK